jgi:DNA-binding beta-propeller fold protein YncE
VHILPQLRELEEGFPDVLAIIGVHSAKYPTERQSAHLRAAVQRLEIDHPVVNDASFDVWQSYAVRAWPSLMFVDPQGQVIGKHEGEFTVDVMAPVIEQMISQFDGDGLLDRQPLAGLTHPEPMRTSLAFPGKVVADEQHDRLYIADTNHNRILVTTLDGQVAHVIGSGDAGLHDGSPDSAAFHHPHGLTRAGDRLYVADTGNHAIRSIDLDTGAVTTIAGTGTLAAGYSSGGPALETALRSPWDVSVMDGTLYIAMAGTHQLWSHEIGSDEVRRMVGSGHEGLRDGPLGSAWLAQPSGMTTGEAERLLFTDSETSSVRIADFRAGSDAGVRTFVGEGLFEFGDIDGSSEVARLQHTLGVAWHPATETIYVADTYNNKIKRLNPETRTVESWLGDGSAGADDGLGAAARFFEPEGISIGSDALYIADTNNHAIRRADLHSGEVTTIDVRM